MKFLASFSRMKHLTNDDPSVLVENFDSQSELSDLFKSIKLFFQLYDRHFKGKNKMIGPVSRASIEALREFKVRWAPAFSYIEYVRFVRDFPEFSQENDPISFADYAYTDYEPELGEPDPRLHSLFQPSRHHGWKTIALLIDLGRIEVSRRVSYDDEESQYYENVEALADGALDFLNVNVGIDMDLVFDKFHQVPEILITKVVSDKHGASEKGSLYDLLNDAIRAYIVGAPAACVALCRAALEMVLVDHYDVERFKMKHGEYIERDGEPLTLPLEIIIKNVEADKRYEWIKQFDLITLKRMADSIMHRYSRLKKLSEAENEKIIEFFGAIKALIEGAPDMRR